MSKKENKLNSPMGYGFGYVITESAVQHLEGRLLTLIESWGLPSTQEQAVKGLVRQEVWYVLADSLYISGDQHTELREKNATIGRTMNVPVGR